MLWNAGSRPPGRLMLSLSTPSPVPSFAASHGDAVSRAIESAGTVSGAYASSPCAFLRLGPQAEDLVDGLRPEGAGRGAWVLVSVRHSAEAGQRVHLHERCLTAAQRVMLALACDGVENTWVGEGLPGAAAFRSAGANLQGRVPVGLVWCAAD